MKKGRKAHPQLSDRNLKTLRILFKILCRTLKIAWCYSEKLHKNQCGFCGKLH